MKALPEAVTDDQTSRAQRTPNGRVAWLFPLGHGHYTQFLNFRESLAADQASRAEWIGLDYARSGDRLGNLRVVPWAVRARRNVLWHAREGLRRSPQWDALFVATLQLGLLPMMRRYPTYYYTDLTPSLMRELAPWYDHLLDGGPVVRLLRQTARQATFNSLRGVFAMSEWAASGVRRDYGLPTHRLHVALPGANLKRWRFLDRSDRSADRPSRILMVGGEFRLKGGELLLEWSRRTTARNWELDIVTWPGALPGWIRERVGPVPADAHVCRSLAPELPAVRVHVGLRANTSDLTQLFTDADIFCLPTQADGSSIASLEAMATGLPVVVGAVGGIPELIDDGRTGFLIRRGDAADLASTLEALLADRSLRLAVGQAARLACVERLNTERQLREILAVIDREGAST